ncbi:MAG: outer membrane beta-barrel protein [Arenicellales bacterium]
MRIRLTRVVRLGALLSALAFPAAGYAQFYVGAGLGQSTYHDVSRVQTACSTVGATCGVDDTDNGYKVFAGYKFGQFLAFEGGYVDLGEAKATSAVPVAAKASLKASGGYISLMPQIPLGTTGAIFGRIGLSAVDAKLEASGGGLSYSDSSGAASLLYGVGAEVHLTNNVSIRGEWERHSFNDALKIAGVKIDAPDVDLLSASLVLGF